LAAARLRGMTPEQLAERLRGGIDLLSTRGGGRRANLNDTIAWSFGLLDAWERTALLQLSVFGGPFTLESAETVLMLDQPLDTQARNAAEPPPETMDVVFSLRDKSLLSLKTEDDRYLLDMLGTIRAFASTQLERLSTPELRQDLRLRHAGHFLAHARKLQELLESPMGSSLKESEIWGIADILAAARWALGAGRHELGFSLALAGGAILSARSRFHDLHRLAEDALTVAGALGGADAMLADPALRPLAAPLWSLAAAARQRAFDLPGAQAAAERAVELARKNGDTRTEAEALNVVGICHFYRREQHAARAAFEQALELNRKRRDDRGVAHALSNVAMTQMHGDYEAMRRVAQEAYAIYTRLGDRRGQARTANTLGVAYEWLHDHDRARELYQDSIRLKLQLGDLAGAANSRANLASMDYRAFRFEQALEQFAQVLEPIRQGGDKANLAMALESMGTICVGLGRPEEALGYLDRCAAIRRETGDTRALLDVLSVKAGAMTLMGSTLDAWTLCEQALEIAINGGNAQDELLARLRAAQCGRPEDRPAHTTRARELLQSDAVISDDTRVLAEVVLAELGNDPAEAERVRRHAFARVSFSSKMMDFLYTVHRRIRAKA
jgi:tetratricopeptide (TPR) repeat protein